MHVGVRGLGDHGEVVDHVSVDDRVDDEACRSSRQRDGSSAASTSAPGRRRPAGRTWLPGVGSPSTLASLYTSASSCRTFTRYALFTPAAPHSARSGVGVVGTCAELRRAGCNELRFRNE